jgi:hypothetical protein
VPYDEALADRVREGLSAREGLTERKMFGGLALMLRGNMCCGVLGGELMVRLGPEEAAAALAEPNTREMDFTGRPMKGMLFVTPEGTEADDGLAGWVDAAADVALSLPAK